MRKELSSILKLAGKNNEIEVVVFYDDENEFDEGEVRYRHILTGDLVDTIDQVLQGWSEQNIEDQKDWEKLIEEIKNDDLISEKVFAEIETIEY